MLKDLRSAKKSFVSALKDSMVWLGAKKGVIWKSSVVP